MGYVGFSGKKFFAGVGAHDGGVGHEAGARDMRKGVERSWVEAYRDF
jgi:hypothetical protein